jgi:hypothetical protein
MMESTGHSVLVRPSRRSAWRPARSRRHRRFLFKRSTFIASHERSRRNEYLISKVTDPITIARGWMRVLVPITGASTDGIKVVLTLGPTYPTSKKLPNTRFALNDSVSRRLRTLIPFEISSIPIDTEILAPARRTLRQTGNYVPIIRRARFWQFPQGMGLSSRTRRPAGGEDCQWHRTASHRWC